MIRALLIGPENSLLRELLTNPEATRDLEICHHVALYPSPEQVTETMEEFAPDMALITLVDYNRALRVMSQLTRASPQLPIIALHTYCDQQLLLELMQAGVRELWFPPLDADRVRKSLTRLSDWRSAAGSDTAKQPGSLIAFVPARGGCGATTVAAHTAAALQKLRGAVLLADFDFHNSILAFWMKVASRHGFHEALERAHWLDSTQWNSLVIRINGLDILTAPQTGAPLVFSGDETAAVLDFARRNYSFVLVDLPDSIYTSCWEVLDNADQILVVSTPEMASLYLARRKVSQMVDHGIPRERVRLLLSRSRQEHLQPAEIEKFLTLRVLADFENDYALVTRAFADAKFVPEDSGLGQQFLNFAESLAGLPLTAKDPKKKGGWSIRQMISRVPGT